MNKELTDIYTKLHLIEQSGHGVPIVVKQYGEKAFEFGTSFIIVTIPFEQPFATKYTVSNATVNGGNGGNPEEILILNALRNNSEMTAQDIADEIGISKRTVERRLATLKENGIIKREGSTHGKWVVYDKIN